MRFAGPVSYVTISRGDEAYSGLRAKIVVFLYSVDLNFGTPYA